MSPTISRPLRKPGVQVAGCLLLEAALPQFDYVFLQQSGWPLTKNAVEMLAKRIPRRTGIERFHWHLLRHTFLVNYLMNGGDPFSLQRILGHTTLEMVRKYVHLADVHVRLQHRRHSPYGCHAGGDARQGLRPLTCFARPLDAKEVTRPPHLALNGVWVGGLQANGPSRRHNLSDKDRGGVDSCSQACSSWRNTVNSCLKRVGSY